MLTVAPNLVVRHARIDKRVGSVATAESGRYPQKYLAHGFAPLSSLSGVSGPLPRITGVAWGVRGTRGDVSRVDLSLGTWQSA